MKKRFFNLLTLTILISSTISFFGCKVDNEYNLDNIDATNLSVLPGVSIPVGSFKMITLGDILKLENQEFISVDNEGNYFFNFKMDDFSYTYNPGEVRIGPNVLTETKTLGSGITVPAPGAWSSLTIEIPASFSSSFEFKENNFVKEIVAIREVNCDAVLHYQLKPESSYHFSKITFLAKSASGKETTITFPEWTVIESCSDSRIQIIDNHILKLKSNITVSSSQGLSLDLNIKGLKNIPEGLGVTPDGKLALAGEFVFDGTLSASGADVLGNFSGPMAFVLDNRFSYDSFKVKSAVLKMNVKPKFDTEDYELDKMEDIDLSGSKIILDNLKVSVALDNGFPVSISAGTSMYTSLNGTIQHIYPIQMNFPASKKTEYIFVGSQSATQPGGNYIVLNDLDSILNPMPDKFGLSEISASTDPDEWVTFETEKDYVSTCSVSISAPAALAGGSSLSITEDVEFSLANISEIVRAAEVSLSVVNSLPFSLTVVPELLDGDGKKVDGASLTVDGAITAGSVSSPTDNPLTIHLDGDNLGNVTTLRLNLTTTSSGEAILNQKQGVVIKNIVLTLPKGIKIQ